MEIPYSSIFSTLDTFTGLPIKQIGRYWYGSCRIDGQSHPRKDKLCCYVSRKGTIRLIEQGQQSLTLWDWLLEYGGCSSNKEVIARLQNQVGGILYPTDVEIQANRSLFVAQSDVDTTTGRYTDNLFTFLCTIFPERNVKMAYDKYQVGSLGDKTVFWYINSLGYICFDKIMTYGLDGHRIKEVKPSRKFQVKDGYTYRCLFGENTMQSWSKKHYVVESEKTALIGYLHYGQTFIASGGSSCLSLTGSGSILLPDHDNAGDAWKEWGTVSEWWNNFKGIEIKEGWDIGDAIVEKILRRK